MRRIKAGQGKGVGNASVIGAPGFGSAVSFNTEENSYVVAYSNDQAESFLQVVNTKGKKVGNPESLDDAASGSNSYEVNHVAYNATDQRVLTVGTEIKGSQRRPVGLGFDAALDQSAGPFVYDNKFKNNAINWVAAAFHDTGEGLVAWNRAKASSGDGFIRAIGATGSPSGSSKKVGSGLPVNVFPLAENLDGQNLVVWTDLNAGAVFGQEASDSASLIGASFRISDAAEAVQVGFNAAAYNRISGESGVIYTRGGAAPAVVFALLGPP